MTKDEVNKYMKHSLKEKGIKDLNIQTNEVILLENFEAKWVNECSDFDSIYDSIKEIRQVTFYSNMKEAHSK